MVETAITVLSNMLRLVPDRVPGKTRLGRMLLNPFLSRVPGVLTDLDGCSFLLPSYAEPIAQHLFTFGEYEPETRGVILEFLSEHGTLIDVGANIGALAIPVAKTHPQASIVCIEADPEIHRFLQDNVSRNGCKNIRTICCVAGEVDGEVIPFYRAPKNKFGMGSIGAQFCDVPVMLWQRSIDNVLAELNINQVDVLKIDVEGAELGVLRGARRLLGSERPPVILFEFADWAEARIPGQRSGDAQELLLGAGYRLFRLEPGRRRGEELFAPVCVGSGMFLALPLHMGRSARP